MVKRVRTDKGSPSPRPEASNIPKLDTTEVDRKTLSVPTTSLNGNSHTTASSTSMVRKDLSAATNSSRPQTPTSAIGKEPPQSPRSHRAQDEKQSRSDNPMAPPSAPSQTVSAQELRETAKQTIANRPERPDDRPLRGSYQTNEPPVPRRRSASPPSRPGTRNASADSRASGGRPRSDRESGEDKKADRDIRQESREHGSNHSRRDSRSDRGTKDREKDKDIERDRDRDRPRDRHGDREKERSHRDRDRERDRDRDRDRHRRDDKDRDRENRKDREATGRNGLSNIVTPSSDSRALPTRPDPSRHRDIPGYEESLGKRRRPLDDEVSLKSNLMLLTYTVPKADRGSSKRSSRKDSHREDRSRRASDKDGHDRSREPDRRKSERSIPPENDTRGSERVCC